MKALQIEKKGVAHWKEVPIPILEQGEVLVKVEGVTTCPHWDMHIFGGKPMFEGMKLEYPYLLGQPGHEAMGEVVEMADDVPNFSIGDKVAVWQDPGNRRQGCYAQFVPIRAEELLKIPDSLQPKEIASLELAMCVQGSFHQLLQRKAIDGKRVAIAGLGPSGLIAIQLAKHYGAKEVIGIDLLSERRDLALLLGADSVLDPTKSELPQSRTQPNAFDNALDTTGLKVSIESLMRGTRNTVAIFGVLRETISFTPAQWFGDFALIGYNTHLKAAAQEALDLILNQNLTLEPLVTDTMCFTEYDKAVAKLKSKEAIKILFDPWL